MTNTHQKMVTKKHSPRLFQCLFQCRPQRLSQCPPRRQGGVALITVLLIVAICSLLATQLISEQQIQFRRTLNQLQGDRAFHYVLSAEEWGREILIRDAQKNSTDSYDDDWAALLPPMPVDGGVMLLSAEEMHGRFNINNLVVNGVVVSHQIEIFQWLLQDLQLNPDLVWPLIDWLDSNNEQIGPFGAETDTYSELTPPYRAANQPMTNPDELAAVKGFTPEILAELIEHIVVLPAATDGSHTATLINVNFATAALLRALSVKMVSATVDPVTDYALSDGFDSISEFLTAIDDANPGVTGLSSSIDSTLLSVQSEYFILNYTGSFDPVSLKNYSIMHRDSAAEVRIVSRAQGEY
ncbi:MAG: type II secretion system minor pseudopilin GspK [Pseudomonadales bacterium]|nr:type II secretion system minor pseudopilin GspK [Pseudomonadales bacterium]